MTGQTPPPKLTLLARIGIAFCLFSIAYTIGNTQYQVYQLRNESRSEIRRLNDIIIKSLNVNIQLKRELEELKKHNSHSKEMGKNKT